MGVGDRSSEQKTDHFLRASTGTLKNSDQSAKGLSKKDQCPSCQRKELGFFADLVLQKKTLPHAPSWHEGAHLTTC